MKKCGEPRPTSNGESPQYSESPFIKQEDPSEEQQRRDDEADETRKEEEEGDQF